MENFNELMTSLVKLVVAILVIVLPVLLKPLNEKISKMVSAKIESLDSEKKEKIFNSAMEILNRLVVTTVEYLEQEYGNEIRKGIADGTRKSEELYELKDKAKEIVSSQISNEVIKILGTKITDVPKLIDNLISEQVRITKNLFKK